MKKILLLSSITTFLLASSVYEQRINSLETQIKSLQKQANHVEKELHEYIPIIETSEVKGILDLINFSPEIEIRSDKMDYSLGNIEGENTLATYDGVELDRRKNYTKDFDLAVTTKFKLNMNARIDEKVKFYGRLIFTTTSQKNQRLCILSRDMKSGSEGSAFDVDKAYIDYTPNIGSDYAFTFSFGVLPTTGGTPMQYAQNNKRYSMFPALVFDMNTYGIIGTQKLNDDNYLRFIAAKAYTLRADFYPYQCNRENIDNANVFGTYFDTKLDFLGDSLLSFGINYLGDFKAHPYLGPDVSAQDAEVLGDIVTFGLSLDIENIKESGIAFFVHTALSDPHPNGETDNYQIIDSNNDGIQDDPDDSGFSLGDYAQGEMIDKAGYSLFIGMKYDISNNYNIGIEYNQGSKYWFSATQGSEDIFNKLATRGDVSEVYGTWKFYDFMHAKVGYMYTNEEYTGSGWHFGEPAKKDGTQKIAYLSLKAKF